MLYAALLTYTVLLSSASVANIIGKLGDAQKVTNNQALHAMRLPSALSMLRALFCHDGCHRRGCLCQYHGPEPGYLYDVQTPRNVMNLMTPTREVQPH